MSSNGREHSAEAAGETDFLVVGGGSGGCTVAGRVQIPFATQAVMMGGNVRVGLEDSLYIARGQLAKSNAEQVAKMRRLIEELGYQIATAKEAREILGLKGADRVKF